MASLDLGGDRLVHLLDALWRAGVAQHAENVFRPGRREQGGRFQQYAVGGLFDDQPRAGPPPVALADGLWQDHLSLGREGRRGPFGIWHTRSAQVRSSKI